MALFGRQRGYADSDEEARAEQIRQRFGDGSGGAAQGSQSPGNAIPPFRARAPGVLMAMAGVGAGFLVVLGLGFRISGDPEPVMIAGAFHPAIGVLVWVAVQGIRHLARRRARATTAVCDPARKR